MANRNDEELQDSSYPWRGRLTTQAELLWGKDRSPDLAEAISATARMLARLAAVRLAHDDAEPDFILSSGVDSRE